MGTLVFSIGLVEGVVERRGASTQDPHSMDLMVDGRQSSVVSEFEYIQYLSCARVQEYKYQQVQ
jgi:hypothetical protein